MSMSRDQTLNKIWVVFCSVLNICIQWSMILTYISFCAVARAIFLQLPLHPCQLSDSIVLNLQNRCLCHVPLSIH